MSKNKLSPVFTLKQAIDSGLSRRQVESKVAEGTFLKVGHGLYLNPNSGISAEYADFIAACEKLGEKIGRASCLVIV